MNPDFHNSIAWRSFGMLSGDESSAFDDAARKDSGLRQSLLDNDRLCAAIAIAASRPVRPDPRNLERVRSRLALPHEPRLAWWPAVSGWAAAAVLAFVLAMQHSGPQSKSDTVMAGLEPDSPGTQAYGDRVPSGNDHELRADDSPDVEMPASASSPAAARAGRVMRGETDKLTQRIARLHEQLKAHQQRERAFLRAVPGMAMPVIMKMSPPEANPDTDPEIVMNDSPLQQLLPSQAASMAGQTAGVSPDTPEALENAGPLMPSAIPIYDVARDAGTIILSNLPPASEGREYNLWVRTKADAEPVRVGILPSAGSSPSESFDFSLGMAQVIPAGFILTEDPLNQARTPHEGNTVLKGPGGAEP
jgi:hypothetical protein